MLDTILLKKSDCVMDLFVTISCFTCSQKSPLEINLSFYLTKLIGWHTSFFASVDARNKKTSIPLFNTVGNKFSPGV